MTLIFLLRESCSNEVLIQVSGVVICLEDAFSLNNVIGNHSGVDALLLGADDHNRDFEIIQQAGQALWNFIRSAVPQYQNLF